jgi:hypothetical protein
VGAFDVIVGRGLAPAEISKKIKEIKDFRAITAGASPRPTIVLTHRQTQI